LLFSFSYFLYGYQLTMKERLLYSGADIEDCVGLCFDLEFDPIYKVVVDLGWGAHMNNVSMTFPSGLRVTIRS
jgi:hypothetical protein